MISDSVNIHCISINHYQGVMYLLKDLNQLNWIVFLSFWIQIIYLCGLERSILQEVVRKYLGLFDITEHASLDRVQWKKRDSPSLPQWVRILGSVNSLVQNWGIFFCIIWIFPVLFLSSVDFFLSYSFGWRMRVDEDAPGWLIPGPPHTVGLATICSPGWVNPFHIWSPATLLIVNRLEAVHN